MKKEWKVIEIVDKARNKKGFLKSLSRDAEYNYTYQLSESIQEAILYGMNEGERDDNSALTNHSDTLFSEFHDLDMEVFVLSLESQSERSE